MVKECNIISEEDEIINNLKECPLCSNKKLKLITFGWKSGKYSIDCNCGLNFGTFTKDELILKWNERKL